MGVPARMVRHMMPYMGEPTNVSSLIDRNPISHIWYLCAPAVESVPQKSVTIRRNFNSGLRSDRNRRQPASGLDERDRHHLFSLLLKLDTPYMSGVGKMAETNED